MARKLKYNNKGYIVDTIYGKETVRMCDSNIAKMKVHEWCYYKVFHWGFFSELFSLLTEQFLHILEYLLYLTINLLVMLLSPLVLVLMARKDIEQSKREVERKIKH